MTLENEPATKKTVPVQTNDFKVFTKEEKTAKDPVTRFRLEDTPETKEEKEQAVPAMQEDSGDMELKIKYPAPDQEKQEMPVNTIDQQPAPDNSPQVKETQKTPQTEEERELYEKAVERQKRLRELSTRIRQPGGLEEIEKEPAYKRRNVELTDVKPSSESEISRLSMGEDEDKNPELKNNSFLHDNVD
jgi:cell division protein FtsZ